jgi:hypothetical protein
LGASGTVGSLVFGFSRFNGSLGFVYNEVEASVLGGTEGAVAGLSILTPKRPAG